jgi:hypothetical protein
MRAWRFRCAFFIFIGITLEYKLYIVKKKSYQLEDGV